MAEIIQFCPKCGREESPEHPFIKGFCIDCFLEDHELASIPKEIKISFCPKCLSIKFKEKWLSQSKKILESLILSKIKSSLSNTSTEFQLEELKGENLKALVSVKGFFEDTQLTINLQTTLVPLKGTCDACMKQTADYWEALIQLRFEKQPSEKEFSKYFNQIKSLLDSFKETDKLSFLLKADRQKNGFDFYIGSNKAARKIARVLEKESKQKLIVSFKLHGIDEHGRPEKRMTYALRL